MSNITRHARQANIPTVVDGVLLGVIYLFFFSLSLSYESFKFGMFDFQDGLFLVTNNLTLVEGNPLAILTPNVYEYKRLVQKVLNCDVDEETASEQLIALCQKYEHNIIVTF